MAKSLPPQSDGVDYGEYLKTATHVYNLMKGQKSGAIGKRTHIKAAQIMVETLQKIIEDLPAIQRQSVSDSQPFSSSKAFFSHFLDIERSIIKQAGASDEYAKKWTEAASKVIDLSSLETVQPENLTLVLAEKLRTAESILRDLEGDVELTTKHRRALLRLCYVVGAAGAFGANSILMPASFPILGAMGPALSQAIAGALVSSTIGKLPGM